MSATNLSRSRRQFLAGASVALAGAGSWTARAEEPAAAVPMRVGVHGMVLFGGEDGLYGSHMPMFHTPHDVQVILRLTAVDAQLDRRLRGVLASEPGALWSIEPAVFDLNRLVDASPLRHIEAAVYEGHFERGGRLRHRGVGFRVERVLVHSKLDGRRRASEVQRFWCFGEGRERFLVKQIDQRPDVDLIGSFRTADTARVDADIALQGAGLSPPDDARVMAALASSGIRANGPMRWLYVETGDLA